mmetsp:Transcript_52266/g.131363  ORF Transcript_52266/g.131363 Transcript_52266/m.131363 type:complete len:117 (-) Transcript_52266:55-405(-)
MHSSRACIVWPLVGVGVEGVEGVDCHTYMRSRIHPSILECVYACCVVQTFSIIRQALCIPCPSPPLPSALKSEVHTRAVTCRTVHSCGGGRPNSLARAVPAFPALRVCRSACACAT